MKSLQIPANTIDDVAYTIKANYYKMGIANFLDISWGGAKYKATCVLEINEE